MVLIKDNHLLAKQYHLSINEIISRLRRKTKKKIELEVDTLAQFKEALLAKPDIILLDNMNLAQLKNAVHLKKNPAAKSSSKYRATSILKLSSIFRKQASTEFQSAR